MSQLPTELYNRCRSNLLTCSELESDRSLRAVFVTAELGPFQSGLPQAASKTERVDVVLDYLLKKCLSDGRPVLPLFLVALRDKYSEGDALHQELARLAEAVQMELMPKSVPVPSPPAPVLAVAPPPPAIATPVKSVSPEIGLETNLSSETKPASPPSQPLSSPDDFWIRLRQSPYFWAAVGVGLGVVMTILFFSNLNCVVEFRLNETVIALIGVLALGAGAVFKLVPPSFRTTWQSAYGGLALVTIGSVVVMRFLPPPLPETCQAFISAPTRVITPTQAAAILPTLTPTGALSSTPTTTLTFTPTVTSSPILTPSANILSPTEQQSVPFKTQVTGQTVLSPDDAQLWLLVQSSENKYYPQTAPLQVDATGHWREIVQVGLNLESQWNKPYTLTVVLADSNVAQQFAEFITGWSIGQSGLTLPKGALILDQVTVIRNNPVVTLEGRPAETKVQRQEIMTGTYANLEPGVWHLYGVVKAEADRFIPYGPFEPVTNNGDWSLEVEFPWPANDQRELSFYTWAVLTDSNADAMLRAEVGNPISDAALSDEDKSDLYDSLDKITLTRAERIAFASDKPGHNDIYLIKADGSGLTQLTNDPAEDADPAWSPNGRHIVFTSRRDGIHQLFVVNIDSQEVRPVITTTVVPAHSPNWSPGDEEWIAFHSEQQGNTDIYKVRPDGTGLTRLTESASKDMYPVWSPDGQQILFFSKQSEDEAGELFLIDADGGPPIHVTSNQDDEGYASWSPNGKQIIFESNVADNRDIYLINRDGSNRRWLADKDYDRHPSFAPDGQRFVFDSSVHRGQLFLASLDGSQPTEIQTGLAVSRSPAWSPGDERIAFMGRTDGDWEIYTIWDDGSELQQLANPDETSNEVQPRLSSDGQWVAFASDISGNYDIWLENARKLSSWQQLTDDPANDMYPVWSPDGRKLAFTSERDGNWEIYVMSANGTNVMRLTNDLADDRFPAWSPDGKHIAFYSNRNGDEADIYLMDATDGRHVIPIVSNPGYDSNPAWSPNGLTLAFATARDYGGSYATEVYTLDLVSHTLRRLTNSPSQDNLPQWSGDGRRIYFTSDRGGVDDIWVMEAETGDQNIDSLGNLTKDEASDTFDR